MYASTCPNMPVQVLAQMHMFASAHVVSSLLSCTSRSTCASTQVLRPIKLVNTVKLKSFLSPELHYMPDGVTFELCIKYFFMKISRCLAGASEIVHGKFHENQ